MTGTRGSEGNTNGERPLVTVASFATEGEAEVARAKLRAYGIESSIDDDVSGGTVPTEGRDGVAV